MVKKSIIQERVFWMSMDLIIAQTMITKESLVFKESIDINERKILFIHLIGFGNRTILRLLKIYTTNGLSSLILRKPRDTCIQNIIRLRKASLLGYIIGEVHDTYFTTVLLGECNFLAIQWSIASGLFYFLETLQFLLRKCIILVFLQI
ncbi:uncharacterized protein LOC131631324 [Vicia villosa]|uniref:uncharacterized protein LOC131631324 n=1 Tax=Vicia villosa TaxID=3911 RepID=UPI00273CF3AF|nr:uncharacterized protein LOC131631324 [Vicia villosa]